MAQDQKLIPGIFLKITFSVSLVKWKLQTEMKDIYLSWVLNVGRRFFNDPKQLYNGN